MPVHPPFADLALAKRLEFTEGNGNAALIDARATCFVVETGATPIAAGAVFLHEGVALLAGASTVPEGRRQGAQLALLDNPVEVCGIQRVRLGHDGCSARQRIAA